MEPWDTLLPQSTVILRCCIVSVVWRPSVAQLETGLADQGNSSSTRDWGCPLARASRVAARYSRRRKTDPVADSELTRPIRLGPTHMAGARMIGVQLSMEIRVLVKHGKGVREIAREVGGFAEHRAPVFARPGRGPLKGLLTGRRPDAEANAEERPTMRLVPLKSEAQLDLETVNHVW